MRKRINLLFILMEKENQLDDKIPKWFAIYTKPRAEKKVKEQLEKYNYEHYLPLQTQIRQWKDRKKKVEVPLFNSYLFVKVTSKEYYEIPKNITGIVKYVTIGGQKISIKEHEIDLIKKLIEFSPEEIETLNENLEINQSVEIKTGKLKGLTGKLIQFDGKNKIAIRINSVGTNLLVQINKNAVKKIK